MDKTRSSQEKQVAVAQGTTLYGDDVSEWWTLLRGVARVLGYVVLVVAVFALSVALGGGLAVAMEFLLGWPDARWP